MITSDSNRLIAILSLLPFATIVVIAFSGAASLFRSVEEEVLALNYFRQSADDLVAEIKMDKGRRVSSEDIENIVPAAVLTPTRHTKELIESVAKANLNILNTPVESMLHTPRQDMEARLKQVLDWGALSTRLGILGTFVGLVFALNNMSGIFEGQQGSTSTTSESFSLAIQATLSKLSFAFITSLWGLLGGILISFVGGQMRKRIAALYAAYGDAFSYGRALAHRIALRDESIHASLGSIGDNLKSVERRLVEETDKLSRDLGVAGRQVVRQAEFLEGSATKLEATRGDWTNALAEIGKASGALEKNAQTFVNKLSEGVAEAKKEFQLALPPLLEALREESDGLKTAADGIEGASFSLTKETNAHVQELSTKLEMFARATSDGYRKFSDDLSEREKSYLLKLAQESTEHTAALDAHLVKVVDTMQLAKDNLQAAQLAFVEDIRQNFTALSNVLQVYSKDQDSWVTEVRASEDRREALLTSFLGDFKKATHDISHPKMTVNIRKSWFQTALLLLIVFAITLIVEIDTLGDPLNLKDILYLPMAAFVQV